MRDEDLKNLPQTIERWKFAEMLEAIGFGKGAQNNIKDFEVDYQGLHVVVYATDENGHRYAHMVPEEIEIQDAAEEKPRTITRTVPVAATHEISIPFVGYWKQPEEATQPCGSRCPEGGEVCELPEGHYFCRSGGTSWPWERVADQHSAVKAADRVETAAISMWQTSCIDADAEQADLEWQEMQGNWLELLIEDEREEYRAQARRMLKRLGLG